ANVTDKRRRVREFLVAELNDNALRPGIQLLDISNAAERLNVDDLEKMLHFFRQRAETVDHFSAETVDLADIGKLAKPAVKAHAKMQIGNVIFRDHDGCADRNLRRPAAILHLLVTLHFGDSLFQHLLIKLEADFLDMAGLFFPE